MSKKPPNIMIGVDFYTKPRNRIWLKKEGAEALIVLQMAWIAISQDGNFRISREETKELLVPFNLKPSRIVEILDSAVEVGLLESDGEYYTNSKTKEHVEGFQSKNSNKSEAAKEREARKRAQREAQAEHNESTTETTSEAQEKPQTEHNPSLSLSTPFSSDLNKYKKEIIPGVHLDEITLENAILALKRVGLSAEWLPQAALEVQRFYEKPEHQHKKPNWPKDIQAGWVLKVLCDLSTSSTRNKTAREGFKPPKETQEDFDARFKNFLEKEDAPA